jgi:hypothetical protein
MKLTTTVLIALAVQTALFSQAAPKLSLKLERIQGEGVSDHAVLVGVRVTNISQQNVDVLLTSDPFQNRFAVVGPDGRPAPPTKDAEELRVRLSAGSKPSVLLAPGRSRAWGYIPLSDLVDFSRPGTYRITVTRHFDAKTQIPGRGAPLDETDSSNVLEVKVP